MSVEAAYVGNRGANVFAGDGPAANVNQPTIVGFAEGVSTNLRRPFFAGGVANASGLRRGVRLDAGHRLLLQLRHQLRTTRCRRKLTKRFSQAATRCAGELHAAARGQQRRRLLLHRSGREPGHGRTWDRTHTLHLSRPWPRLPVGRGKRYMSATSRRAVDAVVGGWQFNANTIIQSGFPFNVTYRDAGAGSRHRDRTGRT